MHRADWVRGWIFFLVVSLLGGCITKRSVSLLERETSRPPVPLSVQQREREALQRDVEKLKKDLETVQKEIQKEMGHMRAQIAAETTAESEKLKKDLETLQRERQREIGDMKTDLAAESKKVKADLLLRLENLQTEVQTLKTGVEEYKSLLQRPSREVDQLRESVLGRTKAVEERGRLLDEKFKSLDEKSRNLDEKIKGIEERLKALEGKTVQIASKQSEMELSLRAKESPVEPKVVSTRIGDLYKDAYETYQKGDYEGARRKFEAFLKQYPNTELSDNAQFWISETYYVKKDYEKAILEYEKAIAKYPEGDKIPATLFKQALAFLELGDRTNGRNLLRRVMERYPQSEQAEMARKRLEAIK